MEKQKDSTIIFLDKRTYDFSFDDIKKALEWAKDKKVWAIKTPVGVLQPMDEETFDNVSQCVFDGPVDEPIADDLV